MGNKKLKYKSCKQTTLHWIVIHSKKLAPYIALLISFNIIFSISIIAFTMISKEVIDYAIGGEIVKVSVRIYCLAVVVFLQLLLRIGCNYLSEYIRTGLAKRYRNHLIHRIVLAEYKEIVGQPTGDIMTRLCSDVQIVADGVGGILPNFINMSVRIIGVLVALYCMLGNMVVLVVMFAFGMYISSRILRGKMKMLHKDVQEQDGKVRGFLQEMIERILVVKSFTSENYVLKQADKLQQTHVAAQLKRRKVSVLANASIYFVFQMGYLMAIIWGVRGIIAGTITYGTIMAVLQLITQIQAPLTNLSGINTRISAVLASAERMIEFEKWAQEEREQSIQLLEWNRVVMEQVSFSYENHIVLQNISVVIKKGEWCSITGLSGSGKSTLFYLLLGIYQPSQGRIYMSTGEQLYKMGKEMRPVCGYIPQGNHLISGSIRDNILLGANGISEQEIRNATSIACATSFIEKLPNGLDTLLGERGIGLSEGQAQRIGIARAVLRKPSILLLDEATSALDEKTEYQVLINLTTLTEMTCIFVTHRKAAMEFCDTWYHMDNGRIIEKELQTEENYEQRVMS